MPYASIYRTLKLTLENGKKSRIWAVNIVFYVSKNLFFHKTLLLFSRRVYNNGLIKLKPQLVNPSYKMDLRQRCKDAKKYHSSLRLRASALNDQQEPNVLEYFLPGTSWNKTIRTRSGQECSSLKDDGYALR